MSDKDGYSLQSAVAANRRGRLAEWVTDFLRSPGSDNGLLAVKLSRELGWWAGPVQLPIKRLHRLAGPADDPVVVPVDENHWERRVVDMRESVDQGWEPPPVIVSFRGEQLMVEDGNHRVESLREAGRPTAWAVVGFVRSEDRDRFLEEWVRSPGPAECSRPAHGSARWAVAATGEALDIALPKPIDSPDA